MGEIQATGTPQSCPQFYASSESKEILTSLVGSTMDLPFFQDITNAGEDCLTLNIIRPAGTVSESGLPVLFWIYGGGFEFGSTITYNGESLVTSAIDMEMPFIFVAANYRVGGFGFLPGKEILNDGSANLGLLDQRRSLEWVADNIKEFGGDPSKVTIWGESAGSISVFDQMALYDGNISYKSKPLFRGAIMDSGSVVPADPVDGVKGQAVYNSVVEAAGCSAVTDTLACLRDLDYLTFLNAVNSVPSFLSYSGVALSYLPRPDGTILTASPDILGKTGKYADVPFIIGDQEDEGTLLALFQSNISTTQQMAEYFRDVYFFHATMDEIKGLIALYPDITTYGSPFRTGVLNNWYPEFKRLAAILGDTTFTLSRRALLEYGTAVKPDVPTWSYLASYDYGTPILGSFHAGDILQVFYGQLQNYAEKAIRSYYFSFVQDMDPNSAGNYTHWPQWSANHTLMQFFAHDSAYLTDNFRSDAYEYLKNNAEAFYV
jgi:triacylglycerol lipase